jgi:hypothetical protein
MHITGPVHGNALRACYAEENAVVVACLLAAVTKLTTEDDFMLRQHHVLPPNLQGLAAGNVVSAACLLPLKQLRELSLNQIEYEVAPAEELMQLTSLTVLTGVDLLGRRRAD